MRELSRLNCWKIIPTFRRVARSCAPRIRVTSSPAMRMLPAVGSSSRLTQRISVLLPVPRTPDDAEDLALRDVEVDAVERDDAVRKDLAQAADLDRC